MRLDQALVVAKLFPTRTKAKQAILDGIVFYHGQITTKPSEDITDLDSLEICGEIMPYVSRGGLKLAKALFEFNIDLTNQIVLDIGSSTGGFTDCALQNGANHVFAVDVGTNQMDATLKLNPKITLYEQTDFRNLDLSLVQQATIAVSDVSFISVTKMLPQLEQLKNLQHLIILIKPQFECTPEITRKYHGIPNNPQIHEQVLQKVLESFQNSGFSIQNLIPSPIQGKDGNIEYLAHFNRNSKKQIDIPKVIKKIFC